MKRSTLWLSFALCFVFLAVLAAPPAMAERGGGLRSIRSGGSSRSIGRSLGSIGRSIGRSHGSSRSSSRGLEGLGRLFDGGRRGSGSRGLDGLGDLFRGGGYGGYGDYGRYGDWYGRRHDHDDEMADAIRDAAIANAVVGVVGIIADSATRPYGGYYEPAPAYPAPAPVYRAPAPQYRTERVLVQEGHYEQYEVWVPESYDPQTGDTIIGHHETRQRWVPEVWQERQVRVYP